MPQSGETGRWAAQEFPSEGKTANTPLRHAKNQFIALTSKAGILGAIPGGVDAERVYQLCDLYMRECEQMQTAADVRRLQYVMLMDFTRRCGAAKLPEAGPVENGAGVTPE